MELYNRHHVPKGTQYTYIGRGTPWGNPFIVGEGYEQGQAADAYRRKLARALAGRDPKAVNLVLGLAGVNAIACSCKPRPCHGDCFKEIWDIIRDNNLKPLEGIREWVKLNGFSYGPLTDGKDHINIYSKAKTKLGKFLTNMAETPFVIRRTKQTFQCLEGYWYYLSTGVDLDFFKDANGWEAKKYGRTLERNPHPFFKELIKEAMLDKLEQYPAMLEIFKKSTLPFKHYYYYSQDDDRTVIYPPFDWIEEEWERIRKSYHPDYKRCIIAGSRDIEDIELIKKAIIDSGFEFDEVVCGEAKGVDTLGKEWAKSNKKFVKSFLAQWDTNGKKAGILRNIEMGDYADMAIVIIKDGSKGSTHMKEYMENLKKPVFVVTL